MAVSRTERLLNLVICLLAATRYVNKEQIRQAVPQYAGCASDEAFERMFERDKDDLREMGIPLETGSNEVFFDDEIGYRIPKDAYALPPVAFDSEELAVLGVAARMWQHATLAGATARAIRKLESVGVDVDPEALAVIEPRVDAAEPAFAALWDSVQQRHRVRFHYSRGGAAAAPRRLQPWGLVSWHGRWYVVGHDDDRGETRVFRLSRIQGDVTADGPAGSVVVPDNVDITASVRMLAQPAPARTARLQVQSGRAVPLRRQGTVVSEEPGASVLDVPFEDAEQMASIVCGFGSAVTVLTPADLKDAVVRRLRTTLESISAASAGGAA
ncbi:MAG: WYL domain-containing protein [Actinomycetia bacterium]|nr:WYL domain-containing protein [Actinomycetes bacterium]